MSDQEKLYRCMGGSHCNHIPGSCTATNTAYQGLIRPGVASHPVASNPVDDNKTANVSVKLRPAVEVWRQAHQALYWLPKGTIGEQGAAAVIEADRQATRAALVAEIVADLLKDGNFECAGYVQGKWGKQ